MTSPTCFDHFLVRAPCAGLSIHGYQTDGCSQLAKVLSAATRVGLVAVAILSLAQICPSPLALWSTVSLIFASIVFYTGASTKQRVSSYLFEIALKVICLVAVVLVITKTCSQQHADSLILGSIGAGTLFASWLEKDFVKKAHVEKNEGQVLLAESFSEASSKPFRLLDSFIGMGRDMVFSAHAWWSRFSHHENYKESFVCGITTPRALCVFIHGLRGTPAVFDDYYEALKHYPGMTFFQPPVCQGGDCSLEEAASRIKDQIKDWARLNPNKEIICLGFSNGARIVGYVTALLKEDGLTNPMEVFCISGPFNGTTIINHPYWPKPFRWLWEKGFKLLYSPVIYEELAWQSKKSKEVIQSMQQAAQNHSDLHYHFYGSLADLQVIPFTSTFPSVAYATYGFTECEGHQSLIGAVQKDIMMKIEGRLKNLTS